MIFIILQLCEATDICPFAKIPDEINEYPTLQLVCPCFENTEFFLDNKYVSLQQRHTAEFIYIKKKKYISFLIIVELIKLFYL